ncbi:MAG: TlpA family protein disulfide reductase [Mariniblastus sp.]|nr:TlpA family protein disulfide reductase [Mariniblastus sp.]
MYSHEQLLVQKLTDKPFVILGVNSDSNREEIRNIAKQKNLTWRSFWNGPEGKFGPISKRWNIEGWPTLYLIDSNGIIRHKQMGGDTEPLDRIITSLLAELGHVVDLSY